MAIVARCKPSSFSRFSSQIWQAYLKSFVSDMCGKRITPDATHHQHCPKSTFGDRCCSLTPQKDTGARELLVFTHPSHHLTISTATRFETRSFRAGMSPKTWCSIPQVGSGCRGFSWDVTWTENGGWKWCGLEKERKYWRLWYHLVKS